MPKIEETARDSCWLALFLVAAMYVVNFVFTKINMAPTTLFTSFPTPVSPISTAVGTKIFNMLAGIIPIDMSSILSIQSVILWMSAFAIVFVGSLLVGKFSGLILAGKTRWAKIMWMVLWGAAIFYIVIVGAKWISINQAIGLFIYTIPVSMVAAWIGAQTAKYI